MIRIKEGLVLITVFSMLLPALGEAKKKDSENLDKAVRTDTDAASASELFKPTRLVTYKQIGDVTLKLHVFEPSGHRNTDKTPSVVFFFGGGFRVGKPSQFYAQSAYLASRGMVAISAEYRIKTVHGTEIDACIKDARSAVRWVRAHANELGIDPDRIAVGGGSAGGFLSVATAALTVLDEPNENLAISCRPNALVVYNGPIDATPREDSDNARVKALEGYGLTWKDISPLHNIKSGFPPMAYFVGEKDKLIPASQIKAVQTAMNTAGSRLDLHVYPGQEHGFFNYDRGDGKYYRLTLAETDRFFASLGWLHGVPTLVPME